jgi:phosphohistidine phosphatase
MKTLILVRHGEFVRNDPSLTNVSYPLARGGKREMGQTARRLETMGIAPGLIVSSPTRYARESAEVLGKTLGLSPEQIKGIPELLEAEKRDIQRVIHQLDDSADTIILVGHNPAVSELRAYLAGVDVFNMKLADFSVLQLDVDRWCDAAFGKANLVKLDAPDSNPSGAGWLSRLFSWRK